MTPAAAIPVFLLSIGVMLAASAVFARRLDHIGLRLGLPEAVLGLLTALAADAPELASAVTARIRARHETLELEAFVGLWLIGVATAVAAGALGSTTGVVLVAVVAVPYVVLLAAGPRIIRRLRLGRKESRFVERSFGEPHRRVQPLDSGREAAQLVGVLLAALCLIVAGSIGAVRSATELADRWSLPQALVGVIGLAILTALPNAWTGVRFGL